MLASPQGHQLEPGPPLRAAVSTSLEVRTPVTASSEDTFSLQDEQSLQDADESPINAEAGTSTPLAPDDVSPLVTGVFIDGEFLPFAQTGDATVGASFGEDRSANLQFDGRFTFERSLENDTTQDNLTILNQYQTVLRAQNVLRERELRISRSDPVTVLGQNNQVTLLADCLEDADATCTYLPGLVTDRDRIDPDTLLPTQINQTSNFGDVVSPETVAAIQAPGFQLGTAQQSVGLDLYFPNAATLLGNDRSTQGTALREETLVTMPALSYVEVLQTTMSNADTAALARTIRGPAIVFDTEQPVTNLIAAVVAALLPPLQPSLAGTDEPSNPDISPSLFFAANNTRIPSQSLTLYQSGIGQATTPSATTAATPQPAANFNAIWLGLSPVTERQYDAASEFAQVSDPRVLLAAGGEGGTIDTSTVTAVANGELFSSEGLSNVYTQNYFTLFEQDADLTNTFIQNDRIRYYPHLSFTGNVTAANDILRYYVGTLAGETIQAYGGVNYQGQTADGWAYRAGAIGVINPNYDRYSNLSAGLSRQIRVGDRETFTVGTSFNWALDQDTTLEDIEQTGQGSDITLQARANLGDVSLGVAQVIGDILPNSQESRTVLDTTLNLGEDVTLAAFWAPFDNATSAPKYGIVADIGFRVGGVQPHFIFSWQNTRYEYGEDLLGNDLSTTSDTFELGLRLDW